MPVKLRQALRAGLGRLTLAPALARRIGLAGLGVAFACVTLWGCSKQDEVIPTRGVVLVVVDTLRADHVGSYGYPRPTTPQLDALASGATRYTRALASSPWTLPSHASLFTGLDPSEHGAHSFAVTTDVPNAYALDPEHTTLAEALTARGFASAAFVANTGFVTQRLKLDQGFDTWWSEHRRAPGVNRALRPWLEAQRDRPFFLFVNYMDAHRPYNVRPRAGFEGADRNPRLIDGLYAQAMGGEAPLSAELVARVIEQYDTGIAHADAGVGELLDALRALGRYDDTLIVVTSDHGEYFGEHQLVEHSKDVYQPALHVPLLVKRAGQHRAQTLDLQLSSAQVPGLVAAALGDPELEALFPRLPGAAPVVAENHFSRTADLLHPVWGKRFARVRRVLFDGPYKWIQSSDGAHELYDLKTDPEESANLVDQRAEEATRMATILDAHLPPLGAERAAPPDPSPREREALRALGYLE